MSRVVPRAVLEVGAEVCSKQLVLLIIGTWPCVLLPITNPSSASSPSPYGNQQPHVSRHLHPQN